MNDFIANPTNPCNFAQLPLLLADQLAEDVKSVVVEHVSHCAKCRQQLELLAGDPHWWSDVESCFRENAEQFGASGGGSSQLFSGGLSEDDSFSADVVVDFLEPCDLPETLGRLGEYEIVEVIGRGGMGVVLKGYQRDLARYVAVKVMAAHLAASGAARSRFAREARAAAAIVHPNVMPIHSVCTTNRLPYLVMPFVICESLQQRIDRQGSLELNEILRIGIQVSKALAAAHAQALVHRDIKPANILLEKDVDRVILTDFGLARAINDGSLTRTGIVSGTPQYMSPEQAQGDSIDTRSDLFSLGSVLYTMATGIAPFRSETTLGILRRISDTDPRMIRELNPQIPQWFDAVIRRLHQKQPDARFQSAIEISEILEQCLAHVQQPLLKPLPSTLDRGGESKPPCRPNAQRRARIAGIPRVIGLGVAILAFLVILPGVVWISGRIGKVPDGSQSDPFGQASAKHGPAESMVTNPLQTQAAALKELEAVWESVDGQGTDDNDPADQRLRLVFKGDWHGRFHGSRLTSESRIKLDPNFSPKRIVIERSDHSLQGIYEVKDDRLWLEIAEADKDPPTLLGSTSAEFRKVSDRKPQDLLDEVRELARKETNLDAVANDPLPWGLTVGTSEDQLKELLKNENLQCETQFRDDRSDYSIALDDRRILKATYFGGKCVCIIRSRRNWQATRGA